MKKNNLIVITGLDGSGKSSLIKALENDIESEFKIMAVYSAYKGFQSPVKNAYVSLPKRSFIPSLAKLLLNAMIWLFDYFIKYLPHTQKGGVVLFDRFYLDELALNPDKYRYSVPKNITWFIRNNLPHPSIYIFLDAPENILYLRKPEISIEKLKEQRSVYTAWLQTQPYYFRINATASLEEVKHQAEIIIREYLTSSR